MLGKWCAYLRGSIHGGLIGGEIRYTSVISKTLFFMLIRHSEGAVIVVVVLRYIYTSCFT